MHAGIRRWMFASTALGVFLLAWLGLYSAAEQQLISTVWPSVGFALAALLTFGSGVAPAATARERLESALRQSEAELTDLFNFAPVGIYRKTPEGELLSANQALAALLGYSSADELMSIRQKYMLYEEPAERERLLAAFASGADALGSVVALHRRDGSSVRVQWDARAVRAPDGHVRYLECFVRDLTDRLTAERGLRENRDQLALLSRRVIAAQESERQAIARGLHDEIGQTLTAIQLNLHALQSRLGLDPIPPELEDAQATLELALGSVLDLSLDLRPSVLDDIGLEAALSWYLHRTGERASLDVQMSSLLEQARHDPAVEVCCYRIAQEAITNVVRHASARHVHVELTQTETVLLLRVRDDGIGFDVDAVSRGPFAARLGLIGMEERAALLGGHVKVASRHGETVLTAALPLRAPMPIATDAYVAAP